MTLNRATESETRVRRALQGVTGRGKANGAGVAKFTGGLEIYEAGGYPIWIVDKTSGKALFFLVRNSNDNNYQLFIKDKNDNYAFSVDVSNDHVFVAQTLRLAKNINTPYTAISTWEAFIDVVASGNESVLQVKLYNDANTQTKTFELLRSDRIVGKTCTDVSTTYTATAFDNIILADAAGGAFTITLPAVATLNSHELVIKKVDSSANAVTIDGNGAETIDGAATYSLPTQYSKVRLVSRANATGWYIV